MARSTQKPGSVSPLLWGVLPFCLVVLGCVFGSFRAPSYGEGVDSASPSRLALVQSSLHFQTFAWEIEEEPEEHTFAPEGSEDFLSSCVKGALYFFQSLERFYHLERLSYDLLARPPPLYSWF